ncbi:hypothetical protein LP414_01820 [Polaromonas sp. P1(28)-13]|nr:hypothetical protein LP414_01820 [Polaromonas sp. P1(28)-13]
MFWDAVINGLSMFTHWQTYVAALIYVCMTLGIPMVMAFFSEKSERATMGLGCLYMLLSPFIQAFALVILTISLSPILLGVAQGAAWSFPWLLIIHEPWWILKLIGGLTLATFILAMIPLIGSMQTLHTFVLGSFTIAVVLGFVDMMNPALNAGQARLWPGGWFVIGLCLISAALTWLTTFLSAILATIVDSRFEGAGTMVMIPLGAAFGFIPLFIYAAWLGSQLHRG